MPRAYERALASLRGRMSIFRDLSGGRVFAGASCLEFRRVLMFPFSPAFGCGSLVKSYLVLGRKSFQNGWFSFVLVSGEFFRLRAGTCSQSGAGILDSLGRRRHGGAAPSRTCECIINVPPRVVEPKRPRRSGVLVPDRVGRDAPRAGAVGRAERAGGV